MRGISHNKFEKKSNLSQLQKKPEMILLKSRKMIEYNKIIEESG